MLKYKLSACIYNMKNVYLMYSSNSPALKILLVLNQRNMEYRKVEECMASDLKTDKILLYLEGTQSDK